MITVPSPLISTVPEEVADNEKDDNRTGMNKRKTSRDKITFMPIYRSRAPVFCQKILALSILTRFVNFPYSSVALFTLVIYYQKSFEIKE